MLDQKNQEFLDELIKRVTERITLKFTKGVEQHGGFLWEKPAFEYMGDEIIDLFCYYVAQEKQNELNIKPLKRDKDERQINP